MRLLNNIAISTIFYDLHIFSKHFNINKCLLKSIIDKLLICIVQIIKSVLFIHNFCAVKFYEMLGSQLKSFKQLPEEFKKGKNAFVLLETVKLQGFYLYL